MNVRRARSAGLVILILAVGWGCAHVAPAAEPAAAGAPGSTIGAAASGLSVPGSHSEIPAGKLEDMLTVAAVDPLQKVFRESSFFPEENAIADVARGEYASFQFVLRSDRVIRFLTARVDAVRSGSAALAGATARFVGYVHVSQRTPDPSEDRFQPISGWYPDPLLDSAAVDVPRECAQPAWITVPIPRDAAPGTYRGTVTFTGKIEGKTFHVSRPFTINVHPVTITETRLWVTNWFFFSPDILKMLNNGQPVEDRSDRYWELIRVLARKMKEYRQNVAWIHPLDLVKFGRDGDRWTFDFADFDKMTGLLVDEGVARRIEGGHIGGREGGWESQFIVNVPVIKTAGGAGSEAGTGNGAAAGGAEAGPKIEKRPISDPDAHAFYAQFIPALMAHLKDKGWDKIYIQHIADEPTPMNTKTYVEIASFIKSLAPELRIIEACHSKDVDNIVNIWVPQLNFFGDDLAFYQARQKAGDEVWFYTCLAPQGDYPNRFIELPLIKTRYIHWLNFRYGATGYLHWGFNAWYHAGNDSPYLEASFLQEEGGNPLPGGDCWIAYPGNGKVLSSIRLEAMRDGIFDHELLSMLAEKQPEKAAEIAGKLVFSLTHVDMDVKAFRRARAEILDLLSN